MSIKTILWVNHSVKIIDQTLLPHKLKYITCRDVKTLWHAIKRLSVRGAPALGVAAGFGVLLGVKEFKGKNVQDFIKHVYKTANYISTSRPTAVNLFNVLTVMKKTAMAHQNKTVLQLKKILEEKALEIFEQDRTVCRKMGDYGATFIKKGSNVLTICNAGALATVDYGTALGVIYSAKKKGKTFKAYCCETRPLLQGARLTAWELMQGGVDTTLICDNMAATLMQQGKVDMIFAGADRIASNGDTANKIGTYSLAVLAKHHKIPLYIVAPESTFDFDIKNGSQIPIEERDKKEVLGFGNCKTAPSKVKVYNPAFDVTDAKLISAIITEKGIMKPVNKLNIKEILKRKG